MFVHVSVFTPFMLTCLMSFKIPTFCLVSVPYGIENIYLSD